jgi:hypothetical protein
MTHFQPTSEEMPIESLHVFKDKIREGSGKAMGTRQVLLAKRLVENLGKAAAPIEGGHGYLGATWDAAPQREKDGHAVDLFCLKRRPTSVKNHKTTEENRYEIALHNQCSAEEVGEKCNGLPFQWVVNRQIPLKQKRMDPGWGKIDLLGLGSDHYPVPIELKVLTESEPLLRAICEVTAYAVALRKNWQNFGNEWHKRILKPLNGSPKVDAPLSLNLVVLAPERYWDYQNRQTTWGSFGNEWKAAMKPLLDTLERNGYRIHFLSITEDGPNNTNEPIIKSIAIARNKFAPLA